MVPENTQVDLLCSKVLPSIHSSAPVATVVIGRYANACKRFDKMREVKNIVDGCLKDFLLYSVIESTMILAMKPTTASTANTAASTGPLILPVAVKL